MPSVLRCSAHPSVPALARCQRCNAALCNDCFRLLADGKPCCDACAVELESGPSSRWPFAVAFAGAALALCFAGVRLEGASPSWELWGPAAALACIIAVVIGVTSPKAEGAPRPTFSERELELEPSDTYLLRAANPYRARIARVARRVVPLSGRSTALIMSAALVLSAVVVPLGLRLPHWIEAELVLGFWWLGIGILLATLLYTGRRLAEDHRFKLELPSFGSREKQSSTGDGCSNLGGCGDVGGCGEAALIVVVLAVAALAAWLVVEIVLPFVFFAVYYFAIKAIGRVARDRHDCEKNLARSLGWGFFWASVYLVPIAAIVATIGTLIRLRAGS